MKPGPRLARIVRENGFEINEDKVRLQIRPFRQQVTGLTVNERPNVRRKYVRQIRAMLHAWDKFGYQAAQDAFWSDYDHKHRGPYNAKPSFARVVRGKIEFLSVVRGSADPLYLRLLSQFTLLPR